jgi:hypothetical protein
MSVHGDQEEARKSRDDLACLVSIALSAHKAAYVPKALSEGFVIISEANHVAFSARSTPRHMTPSTIACHQSVAQTSLLMGAFHFVQNWDPTASGSRRNAASRAHTARIIRLRQLDRDQLTCVRKDPDRPVRRAFRPRRKKATPAYTAPLLMNTAKSTPDHKLCLSPSTTDGQGALPLKPRLGTSTRSIAPTFGALHVSSFDISKREAGTAACAWTYCKSQSCLTLSSICLI